MLASTDVAKQSPRILLALASFGAILNVAFIVRTVERYETRAQRQVTQQHNHIGMLLAGAAESLICLFALIRSASGSQLTAMAFGLTTLFVIGLISLSLRRWTAATVCAAVVVACCGVIVLQYSAQASAAPLFHFTRTELADGGAATLRMLYRTRAGPAPVSGSYDALAAIYRDGTGLPDQSPSTQWQRWRWNGAKRPGPGVQ